MIPIGKLEALIDRLDSETISIGEKMDITCSYNSLQASKYYTNLGEINGIMYVIQELKKLIDEHASKHYIGGTISSKINDDH